jgi:hypothetical protein
MATIATTGAGALASGLSLLRSIEHWASTAIALARKASPGAGGPCRVLRRTADDPSVRCGERRFGARRGSREREGSVHALDNVAGVTGPMAN